MNLARERKAIDAALDEYRKRLDTIPDDKFTATPGDGGWSFAEVYSHIMQATLGASIAMERCASNNCRPEPKGLNWIGRFVMLMRRFPARIKQPPQVAARLPAVKIDKEEARNLVMKCRKKIDQLAPLVPGAAKTVRHKHPRLGALNAQQWLRFIRVHLEHHIKQLNRIEKKLRVQ